MNQIITQVDAFTNKAFTGNPAAVCVLNSPQPDQWMQNVAQEMNLSETAFLIPQNDGFNLRWFTPTVEVPLCGHATLASAHVLWSEGHLSIDKAANFYTKSGKLIAKCKDDWIQLDFPVNHSQETTPPPNLQAVLGVNYKSVYINSLGYLVELESATLVKEIQPNFQLMKNLPIGNIIVTSIGNSDYDFVSRFFAPGLGINEDPVTGAAHCCLAPFWRDRLGKDEFLAYQASSRGGVVKVSYSGGERVLLAGQAVTVMRGELTTV
ncbi:phenazine biosynthesis protein PhzF family [Richelia sinica FACHB-800]|uniref:Phenazine biosynthesis protein PhzF family n=1 Tax=Richelia sinica FACHB-800 TaxID=1357546 RepID=A0A975T403_9NOST|nr:PhzF family phenazine biosynthesis protein [Richelia sinica]MBD2665868.1 PhzF family phenazine biosynthesis protein [Richelia sinica FACHB-800]QXE21639.1 phenazine biosynthesis protein PhzF family [Richelia sinica FACHB-800]